MNANEITILDNNINTEMNPKVFFILMMSIWFAKNVFKTNGKIKGKEIECKI